MVDKYTYEFKKFKSGKQRGKDYVNKRSVKTGKVISRVSNPSKVKNARNTVRAQKRRAEDRKIDDLLRETAQKYHGNYGDMKDDYDKAIKVARLEEQKRIVRERKTGKKPSGRKPETLKREVVNKLERTVGYVTTFRLYWVVQLHKDSPYIAAQQANSFKGDRFDEVKEWVNEASYPIINEAKSDKDFIILPHSHSGACVRLIDRETDETVRKHELGVGCSRKN